MNLMFTAHNLVMLAGGSIDGNKKPLDPSEYLGVTLAGLGIVILALALLVVIILLFGKIFDAINQNQQKKATQAAAAKAPKAAAQPAAKPAPAPPAPPPVAAAVQNADDDEVIAVISAVVALMSEQDGTVYQVKSVKQKQPSSGFTGRSAWAMDGRRNNIAPF